jgi:hypothetical protein
MKYHRLLLAFAAMVFTAPPCHAAVSVILECTWPGSPSDRHALYEVDYDASTVREHTVDEYGAPAVVNGNTLGDLTIRAQISDTQIKWTDIEAGDGSYRRFFLDRYAGTLTVQNYDHINGATGGSTKCHPYVPPHRQKQF